ncbi:MAG TPA: branched-chain amino acid ABC transporter permease [Stellaceae bacterium]|jgi:branched-chain amino acid transport system permease protein|nr:branched-chain amino acid ABC transporter permease [Stellaceae bacterium]
MVAFPGSRDNAWQARLGQLAIGALLIVLVLAPMLFGTYRVFQITTMVTDAIALLGLNILTGYNGQISIGHSAFYAVGAYTVAILTVNLGMPFWVALPCAAAASFIVGFLFGLPALRLGGAYLALATFAFAVAMPQLLKYKLIEPWTKGTLGMSIAKPAVPFGLPIDQDQFLYYLSLLIAVGLFVAGRNLVMGKVGDAMMAVRDHPTAAAAMGIDNSLLKTKTFGVSAMYTGIAGGLGAYAAQYVAPDSFTFMLSISLMVGIVIGGAGTVSGAIYGAIFIGLVPDYASEISKAVPWALYGACLIVCVFVMPDGIHGVVSAITTRIASRGKERNAGGMR